MLASVTMYVIVSELWWFCPTRDFGLFLAFTKCCMLFSGSILWPSTASNWFTNDTLRAGEKKKKNMLILFLIQRVAGEILAVNIAE